MLNSKKSQSEIISYALLVVIALGLAAGVYVWLTHYTPSSTPAETCSDEVSVSIEYVCGSGMLSVTLKNTGLFNIDGFFIRASENADTLPVIALNKTDNPAEFGSLAGRYDFKLPFIPGRVTTANFSYEGLTIKRLQIQPYVLNTKTKMILLCKTFRDIEIEGC